MKRKPSYKQIISGALASTFLLESCVKDYDLYYSNKSVPDINKDCQANLKNSTPFSLLNIQISEDDRIYFNFINKLTADIFLDRANAALFLNNPSLYATNSGFPNLVISLDDDLIKLITALANEAIYNAIKQNDIQKFIRLCKEQGLITNFQIADVERINRLIEANPALLSLMKGNNPETDTSVVAFVVAVAVGAVVAVWAVVVSHAVAVNVAAAGTVVVAAAAGTWFWSTWANSSSPTPLINSDPLLLQIWSLNGGEANNTFLMLSEYENTQMAEFISILEREFPDKLIDVDKEALKQVIALNLKQISN